MKPIATWTQCADNDNYEISECGRVWSNITNKTLKLSDTNGYKHTAILVDDEYRTVYAHRLVYEAYVGTIPDGMEIDHIDGDPANNHVNNLRLVTHQQNVVLSHRSGRCDQRIKAQRRFDWDTIQQIRADAANGVTVTHLANKHNVANSSMWYIVNHQAYAREI